MDHSLLQGPLQYLQETAAQLYCKWQRKAGEQQGAGSTCPRSPRSPACRGAFHSSLSSVRLARSHARVTHRGQDFSVFLECDIQGVLRLRRRSQGTPSPSAAIYRPLRGRFAPGPPCLRQLGSQRRRDNKQEYHRTGPCTRYPADASETRTMLTVLPPPQPPGEKTPLVLSFLAPPGCQDTPQA
jgi:hypothetical protein